MYFQKKKGDIPASYVSLPEGHFQVGIPNEFHQNSPGFEAPNFSKANGRGVFIHQGRDKYVDPEVVAKMEDGAPN